MRETLIDLCNKKACFLLENKLNFKDYEVTEKNIIRICGLLDRSADISKILAENNIDLYEMSVSLDSLEDHFVKLTGGAINA